MGYFAKIESGIVVNVIVADQNFVNSQEGEWIETKMDGSIKKQYANKGMTYDSTKDKFIGKKPYDVFILNDNDDWVAPIPPPDTVKSYRWNNSTSKWVKSFANE